MRKILFKKILLLVLTLFVLTLLFHFHLHPEHDAIDHCLLCQTLSNGFTLPSFIKLALTLIIVAFIFFPTQIAVPQEHRRSYQLRAPPSFI